jgi:uncharacterized protein (DUF427 family)
MSTQRTVKIPGPEHSILIDAAQGRVQVIVAGQVVADSVNALTLREADYPPVLYVPRVDVNMYLLQRSDYTTYCPYKGECNYYSIPSGGEHTMNAVWTYEEPYTAVATIRDHLAFYTDRVEQIVTA